MIQTGLTDKRYMYSYFLQEVSNTLSWRTFEAHGFKKLKHMFTGTLVHNPAIRQENDIIKELVSFWCWLEERNEGSSIQNVNKLPQRFDNLICR